MSPRPRLAALFATLSVAASATACTAHEYWLTPSRFRAGAADTVETRAWVGTGFRGESRAFSAARARRLLARSARDIDLLPATADGAPVFSRFRPADDRGVLIAYESNFASILMPAAEFEEYLALEGLEGPLRERRARADTSAGRERYSRCAKTWIEGDASERLTTPVGLTYELVPLAEPNRSDTLQVRALFRGLPLAGAKLRAWRQPIAGSVPLPSDAAARDSVGPSAEARTDSQGVAILVLEAGGEWLVSGVHMLRASDSREVPARSGSGEDAGVSPPPADWESYWASITFLRSP